MLPQIAEQPKQAFVITESNTNPSGKKTATEFVRIINIMIQMEKLLTYLSSGV